LLGAQASCLQRLPSGNLKTFYTFKLISAGIFFRAVAIILQARCLRSQQRFYYFYAGKKRIENCIASAVGDGNPLRS
jgi:hypothetical protein